MYTNNTRSHRHPVKMNQILSSSKQSYHCIWCYIRSYMNMVGVFAFADGAYSSTSHTRTTSLTPDLMGYALSSLDDTYQFESQPLDTLIASLDKPVKVDPGKFRHRLSESRSQKPDKKVTSKNIAEIVWGNIEAANKQYAKSQVSAQLQDAMHWKVTVSACSPTVSDRVITVCSPSITSR